MLVEVIWISNTVANAVRQIYIEYPYMWHKVRYGKFWYQMTLNREQNILLFVVYTNAMKLYRLSKTCVCFFSAVHFASYLTGFSSMMLIRAAGARCK